MLCQRVSMCRCSAMYSILYVASQQFTGSAANIYIYVALHGRGTPVAEVTHLEVRWYDELSNYSRTVRIG